MPKPFLLMQNYDISSLNGQLQLIIIPVSELKAIIQESVQACLNLQKVEVQPEPDQLLTIQQASALLSIALPTIYGLVSKHLIPVCKQGKRLYFSKQDLIEWIKSGRKKTITEIAKEAKA